MALKFLNARHQSGIETFIALTELQSHCVGADLVITGEGMYDAQSLHGKAPLGIYSVASGLNIPVVLVCGQAKVDESIAGSPRFEEMYTLNSLAPDINTCISDPKPIVVKIGETIAQRFSL
ncbi:Glycerate kinase [Candidatus Nanopelagicaceae bacterium]